MKTFFKSIIAVVIILLLLFTFLVTTQAGLRTVITIAEHIMPGTLHVDLSEGRIIGPLKINALNYRHNSTRIHLSALKLNWRPSLLFVGRLSVSELRIDKLYIQLPAEKETKEKNDHFSLPLQFSFKNTSIHHVRFSRGDEEPTIIQRLELDAHSINNNITINKLDLRIAPYTLKAKGYANLRAPYDVNLTGELTDAVRYYTDVAINFSVKGNKAKYVLYAKAEAPFNVNMSATLLKPFENDGTINASGSWGKTTWPLNEVNYINFDKGRVKVTGKLSHYQFNLSTELDGAHIPVGSWHINGSGNLHNLLIHQLTAKTLAGTVSGQVKLGWKKQFNWQARLTGSHLNPAEKWNGWHGEINFNLMINGKVNQFNATLESTGTVNNQTLKVNSSISQNNKRFIIKNAKIQIGNNALQTHGTIGKIVNLFWKIDAPNLSKINSQFSGNLKTQGYASIPYEAIKHRRISKQHHLKIDGNLTANNLKVFNAKIDRLNIQSQLDPHSTTSSRLIINGKNLRFKTFVITNIETKFFGSLSQQSLQGTFGTPEGEFALTTSGKLINNTWIEQVIRFNFNSRKYEDWRLDKPVSIQFGKHFLTSPFCWLSKTVRICGSFGYNDKQNWQAKLNIRNLNLDMFQSYFPKNLNLATSLDANINLVDNDNRTQGQADILLNSATISYGLKKNPFTLNLANSYLKTTINDDGLTSKLYLNNNKNQIPVRATINLPKYTGLGIPHLSAEMTGSISANWADLSFLTDIIPYADQVSGRFSTNLKLTGTVINPKATGTIQLSNAAVRMNAFGVDFRQINLTANADNKIFNVTGRMNTNGRTLSINGKIPVDPLLSRSTLKILGNNVLIINNKEYQIHISPNLNLSFNYPDLNITGEVLIPKARITPADFTSTTQLPDTVTIVHSDEDEIADRGIKTNINIKLTLGKSIYLQYAGLYAIIGGGININVTPNQLTTATGSLFVTKGFYAAYTKKMNIKTGVLLFTGGPIDNPGLNILATQNVRITDVGGSLTGSIATIGVRVGGTMYNPEIKLYSNPAMDNSDILSYLLFGESSRDASGSQIGILVQAAQYMGIGGKGLTSSIEDKLGINELGVSQDDEVDPETGSLQQNSSFVVGKNLTRDLSISYSVGILFPVNILKVRYRLSKHWAVQSDTSSYGNGADIFYTLERD